jgi:glycyl-tRNA synthetase beta chain
MSELLIELRSGVLPAACVAGWAASFKESLVTLLREVDLAPRQSALGYTGCRLMVLLRGVGEHSRNPPATSLEAAQRATMAVQRALDELADEVAEAGWDLRSGGSRPVSILAVLGGEPMPFEWSGVAAGTEAVGHRIGSAAAFSVTGAEDYRRGLEDSGVEIRFGERRRDLLARITELVSAENLVPDDDAALLELLATECECPMPVLGSFEPDHLTSPRELVRAVLRERQQAFTVSRGGRPVARFVAVVDHPQPLARDVVRGYELSVATLLDDVRFHWARDRALPIAERARRVEAGIVAGGDPLEIGRRERLRALAAQLCADIGWGPDVADSVRAAVDLLDADLDTSLAREFPELVGVIGGLLARAEGHPEAIWNALYDHPLPRRARSTLPRGAAGLAVSAALRADQIALDGLLGGPAERLRAAAEDLVRLVMHGGLTCDVDLFAARACRLLDDPRADEAARRARSALSSALTAVLEAEGFFPAEIRAVCAGQGSRLLPDVLARARGLSRLRESDQLRALVATARRLAGILDRAAEATIDAGLLVDPAEEDLYAQLQRTDADARRLLAEGRYEQWLVEMEKLNAAVERFLAEVLVHDEVERIRANRLALLQSAQRLYTREVRLAELGA